MGEDTMRKYLLFVSILLVLGGAVFSSGLKEDPTRFLTDVDELGDWINDSETIIIDARSFEDYQAGFIPGAVNVFTPSLDTTVVLGDGTEIQRIVQPSEEIVFPLQDAGINKNSRVVIYDAGRSTLAPRLFWILDYYGHKNVSILDGGIAAWVGSGGRISTSISDVTTGNFIPLAQPEKHADFEYVKTAINGDAVLVCNALSAESHAGGAIPNTVNLPQTTTFVAGDIPLLEQATRLEELLDSIGHDPEQEIVFYCGAGYAAAVDYFIARYIGLPSVRMYDGSLRDWTARGGELTPDGAPATSS